VIQACAEASTFGSILSFKKIDFKKVLVWIGRGPNTRSHGNVLSIGRNLQTQPIHFNSRKCKIVLDISGNGRKHGQRRGLKEGGTKIEQLGTGRTERNCFVHLPHELHI